MPSLLLRGRLLLLPALRYCRHCECCRGIAQMICVSGWWNDSVHKPLQVELQPHAPYSRQWASNSPRQPRLAWDRWMGSEQKVLALARWVWHARQATNRQCSSYHSRGPRSSQSPQNTWANPIFCGRHFPAWQTTTFCGWERNGHLADWG